MSTRRFFETFDRWRSTGQPLVLATVFETTGSTYSKAGAQLLVDAAGNYQGLISGGCLEGDLAARAMAVLENGAAAVVEYDMRDAANDEIWGLGLGCEGAIAILLQRLDPADDYRPLGDMARRVSGNVSLAFALVVEGAGGVAAGAGVVADRSAYDAWQLDDRAVGILRKMCETHFGRAGARLERIDLAGTACRVLVHYLPRPVSLLLLGAGPDAGPLVRLARELGWRVTVADHRDDRLQRIRASDPDRIVPVGDAGLTGAGAGEDYDAAVIMSHHLPTDRTNLERLAATSVPYIGLLGPPARRERLLADLGGDLAAALRPRLHGPVGLDIGARGPEAIALSVTAQVYALLDGDARRDDARR